MLPVLSLLTTLVLTGVVFSCLHFAIVWLKLTDLPALLVYAAPISFYLAYCTEETATATWRAGLQSYAVFCAVVLSATGIVYLIGT